MGSTIDKMEDFQGGTKDPTTMHLSWGEDLNISGNLTISDEPGTITFNNGTTNLMYYNTQSGINTITPGSPTWINHNLDVRSAEARISNLEIQISSLQMQLQQMLNELNQLKLDGVMKKTNRRTLFKSNQ